MGVGLVRSLQPPDIFGFIGEYMTPLLTLASGYSFYPLLMSMFKVRRGSHEEIPSSKVRSSGCALLEQP